MRTMIGVVLLGLATAGCATETTASAPPAGSPSATAIAASTSPSVTSASKTPDKLSASWVPKLQSLALESCRATTAFTMPCLSDSMKLKDATTDLGREADNRGFTALKAKTVQVGADLDQWINECSTSTAGTPARTKCLKVIIQLPVKNEDLIAAIYAAEAGSK